MPDYLDLDLSADAAEMYSLGLESIQAEAGIGWEPSPIESWLLMAVARMASEVVVLAGQIPVEIFRYFGQTVLRIPAIDATSATGTIALNITPDPAGHVLEAGAQFDVDGVGFRLVADIVIGPDVTGAAGEIVAVEPGSAGSGLTGESVQLISPNPIWVEVAALAGITSGGADGETPTEYVDRLADELPTLSPKAILVPDYATLARRDPGVFRAMAINRYVPAGPGGTPAALTDEEGALTVAVQDVSGGDPGTTVRQRVADSLTGSRVRGVLVSVIAPTYTAIDVSFTARAHDGWDPDVVEATAIQAVSDFLSPTSWGRPDLEPGTVWVNETVLRRNDLFGVLYNVQGIRAVDTLELAVDGDTLAEDDITLDGPAPLPTPADITGTVTL